MSQPDQPAIETLNILVFGAAENLVQPVVDEIKCRLSANPKL